MPKKIISLMVLSVLLCPVAYANDIEGRWLLSLQDKKRTLVGLLEIVADSRDIRGFVFDRKMIGKIDGESMSGTYSQEGAAAQAEDPGPWRAVREQVQIAVVRPAKPVHLSGTWTATQELDFRKYTMALSPAGKAWLESYLPYYDQPDVRCTSIGLPALATYSFPFEIIESDDRYTMIYEYKSKVRRIWMDGREPSEYMPPSRMGWPGTERVHAAFPHGPLQRALGRQHPGHRNEIARQNRQGLSRRTHLRKRKH